MLKPDLALAAILWEMEIDCGFDAELRAEKVQVKAPSESSCHILVRQKANSPRCDRLFYSCALFLS